MGVGEQQVQLALAQLTLQRRLLLPDLLRQVRVVRAQLRQLDQVPGPVLEVGPSRDVVAQLAALAREGTGGLWVVPDAGLREPPVQVG